MPKDAPVATPKGRVIGETMIPIIALTDVHDLSAFTRYTTVLKGHMMALKHMLVSQRCRLTYCAVRIARNTFNYSNQHDIAEYHPTWTTQY